MQANLFEIPAPCEPRKMTIQGKKGGAARPCPGVCLGCQHHDVTVLTIGDKSLLAVDDEIITIAQRRGSNALQVRTGCRLRHADGPDTFTRCHLRQVTLTLLFTAEMQDIGRCNVRMHGYA